jgi:hypothetical protein
MKASRRAIGAPHRFVGMAHPRFQRRYDDIPNDPAE